MATLTAVGVRLDLDGPRPVAPPHSLLNTPGVLVDPNSGDEDDQGRWTNGAVLDIYPDDVPTVWDPCSTGTSRVKGDGNSRDLPTFDPFVLYLASSCSYFSSNALAEMVQAAFEASQSYGVEYGLAHGIFGMTNPFLGDANLVQLGADGISAAEGLARLENAIAATGRKGIIHATPAIVSMLAADKLEGDEEGNLITSNGTPVVSGSGYLGVHPHLKTAPSDGKDWMFATGPVEVRLTPPTITDLISSLDRSDNTITYRAERVTLATWDAVLQVGVLVDWAP